MEAAVWTVPAARMKASKEHRVPVVRGGAGGAVRDGATAPPKEGDSFIFPGGKAERPLSSMAMLMLLRRMDLGELTVHGFRSAFRDWCEEATSTPHAVSEAALAHTISDKVECTAPGFLDTRLHYAARLRLVSRRAARASSGLR